MCSAAGVPAPSPRNPDVGGGRPHDPDEGLPPLQVRPAPPPAGGEAPRSPPQLGKFAGNVDVWSNEAGQGARNERIGGRTEVGEMEKYPVQEKRWR